MQQQQRLGVSTGSATSLTVTTPADPTHVGPAVDTSGEGEALAAYLPGNLFAWSSDGHTFRLATDAGLFRFEQNCIIFPNGQMICGENLPSGILTQPTPVPGAPPYIIEPTNMATGVSLTTRIGWNDTDPVSTYELQVSTDPSFGSTVIDITTGLLFYDVPGGTFTNDTLYYARVRGATPSVTAWSSIVSFTTLAIRAGRFNGADIQLQTATEVVFGSGDFTIMSWFYLNVSGPPTSYQQLWNSGFVGAATDLEVSFQNEGGSLPALGYARSSLGPPLVDVSVASPSAYNNGLWHHVAFTRAGSTFSLYVDGGLVASAVATIGAVDSGMGAQTVIGNGQNSINNRWLSGFLSDLRAYDSAVSQANIIAIYSAGLGAYPAVGAPVLWLKMDEGTGTVAHDSASGNDATFAGTMPYWN